MDRTRWTLALVLVGVHAVAACSRAVAPDATVPDGALLDAAPTDAADATTDVAVDAAIDVPRPVDATADERPDAPDVCRAAPDATSVATACGATSCAAGERCNAWTGRCQSTAAPFPPPGGDIGAACADDSACRSSGGLGAGTLGVGVCQSPGAGDWPGGYCRSYCNLCPDTTSVWDVASLGQSNCPQDAVCLPVFYAQGSGYGACMRACRVDGDCREAEGYYCRRTIGARTYANGYCAPAHCRSRGCASSYECFC